MTYCEKVTLAPPAMAGGHFVFFDHFEKWPKKFEGLLEIPYLEYRGQTLVRCAGTSLVCNGRKTVPKCFIVVTFWGLEWTHVKMGPIL